LGVRRGEIWWADLPPPAGRRPVVLLSRNEAYEVRALVTIAPVTTRIRHIPVEVELRAGDGVPRTCAVNLDTITTIPKTSLSDRLTTLSVDRMAEVEDALRFALGMGA
jgi:mRNA interferase MazF